MSSDVSAAPRGEQAGRLLNLIDRIPGRHAPADRSAGKEAWFPAVFR
jgi:hypothetical protein